MDAKRHARLIGQPCAPLAGHVVLSKFGLFHSNEQVRVVTRFFIPLGGGERPLGFAPTFTGHRYYSKTAADERGGFWG